MCAVDRPTGLSLHAAPDPLRPQIRFEAIGEAWNLFTQQMGAWIGVTLILVAPAGLPYIAWMFWILSMGVLVTRPSLRGSLPPIPDLNAG